MDDPWDVKSNRLAGQYVSCMRINGVPLLPPVISKECRKEMQYYKLLAKEVENRISLLQPYVFESSSDSDDTCDALELPEFETCYELPEEKIKDSYLLNRDKIKQTCTGSLSPTHCKDIANVNNEKVALRAYSPKFYKDLNTNIVEANENAYKSPPRVSSPPPRDIPERDYNCVGKVQKKEAIVEVDSISTCKIKKEKDSNLQTNIKKDTQPDSFPGIPLPPDGPSSLSSKSFTGSLNDLHSESIKDSHVGSTLIRQSSYTLLNPSPQLLAHLKNHSKNTGVAMNSISMSESLSNVNSIYKKRRSWDLETAKAKWSTMALELKQTNVINVIGRPSVTKNVVKPVPKTTSTARTKSVAASPSKRTNTVPKTMTKSESLSKPKKTHSPVRNITSTRTLDVKHTSPKVNEKKGSPKHSPTSTTISESGDPAARVRELYEKIQKQQLMQMASLVEKQQREQLLLQQVFEEQNCLLFKQLKTICPTSSIEAKAAWGEKTSEGDRGPVSLSQLINYKSPDQSYTSPASSTLADTKNHMNHCDDVLKKSRNITSSIKNLQMKSRIQNSNKNISPKMPPEGSRTRTHSPVLRNTTPRRLNYDTSASSDRDYEPMLTDRTNDTLADLNVTFPTDYSENGNTSIVSVVNHFYSKEVKAVHGHMTQTSAGARASSTDNAIKSLERNIRHSINTPARPFKPPLLKRQPTTEECAAATKIVAHAKGYLVRRLMCTERVQGTVQTIKDALLCALQLHQDREGIRGADVDLHRRLIQQITAACYTLHDTFVASTPAERCAMIAADRGRRRSLAARQPNNSFRQTDIMSQSHSGSFPARTKRPPPSLMTQSNYETFSGDKSSPVSRRYMASPRRRPWR